jgi:hypothetical protein
MSDLDLARSPAQAWIIRRRNEEYTALRKAWKKELPQGWITRFLEEGLLPLLKIRGYIIGYSLLSASRYCSEWASSHMLVEHYKNENLVIIHKKNSNQGNQDEQDWFFHNIPSEDWISLCERWSTTQFLDDSDVGYAQQMDLPYFAWRLVSLSSSRAHQKYLEWSSGSDENTAFEDDPTHPSGYDGERK